MRFSRVEQADRDVCREAVLEVLRAQGATVEEATHSHARFDRWRPRGAYSFARDGYVGLHGHVGEPDVDVRTLVRASAPRRTLLGVSLTAVVVAILLFAAQPRPGVWILAAVVLWPAWIAALVSDIGARRVSRELEKDLHEAVLAGLRARGQRVLTEEEVQRRRFEAELEGEIVERRLKESRSKRS